MNTFDKGITLRQLQKEWEMHVQHRSGKATSRIMSFLGLGPRVEIRDPQSTSAPRKKKKKRKKPRRRPGRGPAEVTPSATLSGGAGRTLCDSADENSDVFIKKKPIPQSVAAKKKPVSKPVAPKQSKSTTIARGSALERVMKSSPFLSPVVSLKVSPESPDERPHSAPAGGAARSPMSPIRFPGDDIPPDVFCTFPPEEVQKFLVQNGFGHYVDQFLEMGIWGEDLLNSDDSDLQSCGVSFKPHRRRLLSLMDCIFNNRPALGVCGVHALTPPPVLNRDRISMDKRPESTDDMSEEDFVVSKKIKPENEHPKKTSRSTDIYLDDKDAERPFAEPQEDISFLPPGGSETQMPGMNRDTSNYQVTSWIDTIGNSVDNAENTVEQVLIQNSMLGGLGKEDGTEIKMSNDFDNDDGGLTLRQRSDRSPTREELMQSLRAAEAEVEKIRIIELEQLTAQLEQHRAFIARKKELQRALERSTTEELSRNSMPQNLPADEDHSDKDNLRSLCTQAANNISQGEVVRTMDSMVELAVEGRTLASNNDQVENEDAPRNRSASLTEVYKRQEIAAAAEENHIRKRLQIVQCIENDANAFCAQAEFSAVNTVDNICTAKVMAFSIALEKVKKSHSTALEAFQKEQFDKAEAMRKKAEEEALSKTREIENQANLLRQKESDAMVLLEAHKDEIRLANLARLSAEEAALGKVRELENQANLLRQKESDAMVLLEAQKDEIRLANLGRLSAEEESIRKAQENTELAKLLEQEVSARETTSRVTTVEKESRGIVVDGQIRTRDEEDDYEEDFEVPPASSQVSLSMNSADSGCQHSMKIEDDSVSTSGENLNMSAHNMAEELRVRSAEVQAEAMRIVAARVAEVEAARREEISAIEAERAALVKLKAEQESAKAELVAELERHRQEELQRLAKERAELESDRAAAVSSRQQQELLVTQAASVSQAADAQRLVELEKLAEERDKLQNQKRLIEEEAANSEKLREERENRQKQELARLEKERIDFEDLIKKQQTFQLQQEVDAIRKAEEAEVGRLAELSKLEDERRGLDEQKAQLESLAFQSAQQMLEVERRRLEETTKHEIERAMLERQVAAAEDDKARLAETAEIYRQAELSRIAMESLQQEIAGSESNLSTAQADRPNSGYLDAAVDTAISSTHLQEAEKSIMRESMLLERLPLTTGKEASASSEPETRTLSSLNNPPQANVVAATQTILVENLDEDDVGDINAESSDIAADPVRKESDSVIGSAPVGRVQEAVEIIEPRKDFSCTAQQPKQSEPSSGAEADGDYFDIGAPSKSLVGTNISGGRIFGDLADVKELATGDSTTPSGGLSTAVIETHVAVDESKTACCESPQSLFVGNLIATVQSQLVNGIKQNIKDETTAEHYSSNIPDNDRMSKTLTSKRSQNDSLRANSFPPTGSLTDTGSLAEENNFNIRTENEASVKEDLPNSHGTVYSHEETVELSVSKENRRDARTSIKGTAGALEYVQKTLDDCQERVVPLNSDTEREMSERKISEECKTEFELHSPNEAVSTVSADKIVNAPMSTEVDSPEKNRQADPDMVETRKPGKEWIEVKGSFGGLYYHQSTKEFREPHEIFEQGKPFSDVARSPLEDTTPHELVSVFMEIPVEVEEKTHQPLQKHTRLSSNDSEDDVASLMSVSEAINELEDAFLKKKKEKEARDSAKFLNMPPPSTPVPNEPPLSMKKQLSFSGRSASFQEKVKLPYSPSFAELQQQQQIGQSGTSFGTEFNQDFDPMGNLYYGSFNGQSISAKSFVNTQPIPTQPFNSYSEKPTGHDQYNNYISAYEANGGDYQDGYHNMEDPYSGNGGYDYERDLCNNNDYYSTPQRQHYTTDYNSYGDAYGSYQQHEDNPYWRWDTTNQVWVPKDEYTGAPSAQGYNQNPVPQVPIKRLYSGVSRPAYGIARKKSSSKKSRNSSGSFGGDIADFEDQARRGSSQNMLGLAFNAVSSGDDDHASATTPQTTAPSPRSALKVKKTSLWG